eukprot:CAMPEP_0175572546 /NCGR_PEP_ID=MMETSP0096-20121207/43071_1 /TAXON_ID=311494 /ORGANISM="Alexandrium monilatum, Strain CCMP3105" /LENGTH=241 /DNA_ID=CAMNT_0016875979 /DNA_START=157 /DNA_END=882 /DNA_ORIENTATION=+
MPSQLRPQRGQRLHRVLDAALPDARDGRDAAHGEVRELLGVAPLPLGVELRPPLPREALEVVRRPADVLFVQLVPDADVERRGVLRGAVPQLLPEREAGHPEAEAAHEEVGQGPRLVLHGDVLAHVSPRPPVPLERRVPLDNRQPGPDRARVVEDLLATRHRVQENALPLHHRPGLGRRRVDHGGHGEGGRLPARECWVGLLDGLELILGEWLRDLGASQGRPEGGQDESPNRQAHRAGRP